MVSPTHAEAATITTAIREGLRAKDRITKEHTINTWVPTHLTEAQKTDATQYDPGYLVQFNQNTKTHKKGDRLIVGDGVKPPVGHADRFEVYRPQTLSLGVGERIRLTAGGKTKNGDHRLNNGSMFTIEGFTKGGDIIVDHGWVIDRDFGHLTHGYVVTSHASQGVTVDKVFIGLSSDSFPATNERTSYVAITRGKEKAVVFTDDRDGLLKAMSKPDDPLSATELAESQKPSTPVKTRRPQSQMLPSLGLGSNQESRQPVQVFQDVSHER